MCIKTKGFTVFQRNSSSPYSIWRIYLYLFTKKKYTWFTLNMKNALAKLLGTFFWRFQRNWLFWNFVKIWEPFGHFAFWLESFKITTRQCWVEFEPNTLSLSPSSTVHSNEILWWIDDVLTTFTHGWALFEDFRFLFSIAHSAHYSTSCFF